MIALMVTISGSTELEAEIKSSISFVKMHIHNIGSQKGPRLNCRKIWKNVCVPSFVIGIISCISFVPFCIDIDVQPWAVY